MPRRVNTTPIAAPRAAPLHAAPASTPAPAARAWAPRAAALTPADLRLISSLVTSVSAKPDQVQLFRLKAAIGSLSPAARRAGLQAAFTELEKKLPCSDDASRANVGATLFFLSRENLGAQGGQRVARALLGDAIKAGDVETALESIARYELPLSASQAKALCRQVQVVAAGGDAQSLLASRDALMLLSRTLVRVLASEPGALAKFARGLPQPEVLALDVLANDDRAMEKPLLELVSVFSPKQARDLARHPASRAHFPALFRALEARGALPSP